MVIHCALAGSRQTRASLPIRCVTEDPALSLMGMAMTRKMDFVPRRGAATNRTAPSPTSMMEFDLMVVMTVALNVSTLSDILSGSHPAERSDAAPSLDQEGTT
jgi:hypothetical protein